MSGYGYLTNGNPAECFGCEACVQACTQKAIRMQEDREGFRYPNVDHAKCNTCGVCHSVCPWENPPEREPAPQYAFGGYHIDPAVRQASTSGGAFSALISAWCEEDSVVFGAVADGLEVSHRCTSGRDTERFRKSKYVQSKIGSAYRTAKCKLQEGKKVLFSGTPCQIAGLKAYLRNMDQSCLRRLLTVEVVCEGVPSPLFVQKYNQYMRKRFGSTIETLDYRDKDGRKWDFEVMTTKLRNGRRIKRDRWFNPFWSIWLAHLMSRPSCYQCPYAVRERIADITLGDLWGVHLYCPELYGRNGGASLIVCSTTKGKNAVDAASRFLYGHTLDIDTAIRYQSPMRKTIDKNPCREEFMDDIHRLSYQELCRKWARRPTLNLLWSKYVWGNQQKVFVWNILHRRQKGGR